MCEYGVGVLVGAVVRGVSWLKWVGGWLDGLVFNPIIVYGGWAKSVSKGEVCRLGFGRGDGWVECWVVGSHNH